MRQKYVGNSQQIWHGKNMLAIPSKFDAAEIQYVGDSQQIWHRKNMLAISSKFDTAKICWRFPANLTRQNYVGNSQQMKGVISGLGGAYIWNFIQSEANLVQLVNLVI